MKVAACFLLLIISIVGCQANLRTRDLQNNDGTVCNCVTAPCDCDGSCPPPDPAVLCIALFKPVRCGDCEYSNSCVAAAAGFKGNQCVDVSGSVCNDPDPTAICFEIFAPVDCNGCEYSNLCFAKAAGYTESQCSPLPVDPPTCPPPNPAVRCAFSEFAYKCGPGGCFYDSECLATSAGFDVDEECVAVNRDGPTCPVSTKQDCGKSVNPVTCSNDEFSNCTYDNRCSATAAGFNIGMDC